MPPVATNTNPAPFDISMCWYLTVFTGENLQVFQSDPSCFQQPLDEILSQINFRKILCSVGHWLLNSVICGFWKLIRKQRFYTSLNAVVHYFFYRVYFDHWSSFVNNRPITSKIKILHVVVMNVNRGIKLPDLILS